MLGRRVELPALQADGTEFPVELAVTRIPTDGPPRFTAYLRDISERARTERFRSARLAVTQVLAQADTIPQLVWMANPDRHVAEWHLGSQQVRLARRR